MPPDKNRKRFNLRKMFMTYDILTYLKTSIHSRILQKTAGPETTFGSVFVSRFLGEFGSLICCGNCKLCWMFDVMSFFKTLTTIRHKVLCSIPVRILNDRILMISTTVYNFINATLCR